MQNKVLLVGDSPTSMAPYILSYIEIFKKNKIPYELIYWNKTLEDISILPKEYIPYNHSHDNTIAGWKKILRIYNYSRFVKQRMRGNEYAYVVIFTIAHTVFFHSFLKKKYKGRYVFDIRDYSPLCGFGFINGIIKKLINNSAFTVISSRGFLRWLPCVDEQKIIISHNITISALEKNEFVTSSMLKDLKKQQIRGKIILLTIGQLRDFSANKLIIDSLCNKEEFELVFSGDGPSKERLEKMSLASGVRNIKFTGRYKKSDEEKLVRRCDFINNFTNRDINSDTLLSNRFYLAVCFRKPMIVRAGTYQAEVANKFGLACVIEDKDNVSRKIHCFMQNFDIQKYSLACERFMGYVKKDIENYENSIIGLYETI